MERDVKDLELKVKKIQKKYGIAEEDMKILRSSKRSPMLSGRILKTEKEALIKLANKENSTQSKEIRKELKKQLDNNSIKWNEVKLLKGESIKGLKTDPVRVKVDKETEKLVIKLCKKNRVTISSFIRYLVVSHIRNNEGSK